MDVKVELLSKDGGMCVGASCIEEKVPQPREQKNKIISLPFLFDEHTDA
jgi:hypothetical protein